MVEAWLLGSAREHRVHLMGYLGRQAMKRECGDEADHAAGITGAPSPRRRLEHQPVACASGSLNRVHELPPQLPSPVVFRSPLRYFNPLEPPFQKPQQDVVLADSPCKRELTQLLLGFFSLTDGTRYDTLRVNRA